MSTASAGRDRLAAVASGRVADRPPVSFWRHFYTAENEPEALALALLEFHRAFAWDWIKINPRASYHVEAWGYRYEPSTDPQVKPRKVHFPVQHAADWEHITPKPAASGALGEQLQTIAMVARGAQGDPVLMTVFSPLSIAARLVPNEALLLRHLQECPERVRAALEAITQTFEGFVDEVLSAGADGIFFATTEWASRTRLDAAAYRQWGRPYDLRVLARAGGAPFNLLHVCHAQGMLLELCDYPAPLLNWGFADAGNLDLKAGHRATGKPVIGGVSKDGDLQSPDPEALYRRVLKTASDLEGVPWGCGPDCAIHPSTPLQNLEAVKRAVADISRARAARKGSGTFV